MDDMAPMKATYIAQRQYGDSREKVAVLSTHSFEVQGDVARRTISTAKELLKRIPNGSK